MAPGLTQVTPAPGIQEPKIIEKRTLDGEILSNGEAGHPGRTCPSSPDDDDLAVLSLRNLLFDICNQNGGGHGGSAIGMAAIGVALFRHEMRFNPGNPDWFNRDRFVLSNGESVITEEHGRIELTKPRTCCDVSVRSQLSRWV